MRKLAWFALGLVALFGALALAFVQIDIPGADLEKVWANKSSKFAVLPSGLRVHYRDQGNPGGPVLLLLHGSNASLHTWEPWAQRLGDRFRVVSVDLPGHGLTGPSPTDDYTPRAMVAFIDEFREALKLDRVHLGGNSYGGFLAWRYTLAHPERVDHLVLVDSAGFFRGSLPFPFQLARIPVVNKVMLYVSPRVLVKASLEQVIPHHERITAEMIDRYHQLMLREGNRRATVLRLNAPLDFGADKAQLAAIHAPTLILWGSKDPWIPLEHARLFHDAIPGSTLRVYEGMGHVPMEEAPDETAADVRAFLSQDAKAPGAEIVKSQQ